MLFPKVRNKNLDKMVNLSISQSSGVFNFNLKYQWVSLILTKSFFFFFFISDFDQKLMGDFAIYPKNNKEILCKEEKMKQ
jgi:hypothetical protein